MNFRLAKYEDLNNICSILKQVIKNKHKGLNWTEDYPSREVFKQDIENKELYLLTNDDYILGVVVLNKDQDESYAGLRWECEDTALVIHRLFISDNFKGKGYGKLLIDKCIDFAKENSLQSIRLDTFNKNIMAQKLYESKGFEYRGRVDLNGKSGDFYCYELIVNGK